MENKRAGTAPEKEMVSARAKITPEQGVFLTELNAALGSVQAQLNVAITVALAGHGVQGPVQVLGYDPDTHEIEYVVERSPREKGE